MCVCVVSESHRSCAVTQCGATWRQETSCWVHSQYKQVTQCVQVTTSKRQVRRQGWSCKFVFHFVIVCDYDMLGWLYYLCLLTTHKAAWYIISVVSVCLLVCLSDDNFRRPQVHICVSSSYMKVIGSRSQEQKRSKIFMPATSLSLLASFSRLSWVVVPC